MTSEGGRMASTRGAEQYAGVDGHEGKMARRLKAGSIMLSIWCGINFVLAFIILSILVVLKGNSPILALAFGTAEIASLDAKVIAALNCLTILYNSCSVVVSVLTWPLIRKDLIAGRKWAFWMLLFVIGFVELMAFIASAPLGNARWQVNVVQSTLYFVGIGLCACPILKPRSKPNDQTAE